MQVESKRNVRMPSDYSQCVHWNYNNIMAENKSNLEFKKI